VSTSVEIPFSGETKRILQRAAEEADALHNGHIGSEHLLLGILREDRSVAASILLGHGMRLEAVRDDIVELTKDAPAEPPDRIRATAQRSARRSEVLAVQLFRIDRIIADVEALATRSGDLEAAAMIVQELRLLRAWFAGNG
jgi:ATP-dependent Clp protease ATP-binding subunit ClpC